MIPSTALAVLLALGAITVQREPLPSSAPQPPAPSAPGTPQRLTDIQLGLDAPSTRVQLPNGSTRIPSNWTQFAQPDGSFVIAPPAGAGPFGIAYGVLFDNAPQKVPITDSAGLTKASDELVRQLSKTRHLKADAAVSNFQIAGQTALARELHGASPITDAGSPVAERDWLLTFARPTGSLGYVIFIAPEPDSSRLQPVWDTMIQSFKLQ
jgi:beta-barrel assembly-enhancing protease